MATNKFLSLEQFTFIVEPPDVRTNSLCVNFYADGRLILNGRLAAELSGKAVQIRFTDDARHLCFVENDAEKSVRFPKNGSKRLPSATDFLKKHKMSIPARYEISYNEEYKFWQGDYCENPTQARSQNHTNMKRK